MREEEKRGREKKEKRGKSGRDKKEEKRGKEKKEEKRGRKKKEEKSGGDNKGERASLPDMMSPTTRGGARKLGQQRWNQPQHEAGACCTSRNTRRVRVAPAATRGGCV